ncbi:DNA protecting protein DprA [Lampropedia hyalina DSM 16112]|jgi:DNA processing protein|uniref:DNA protecting protein DprA n=2 Tax=Lampropedia TaxID=198705 RepID=A0A1M5D8D8_9BURK|nr:DNA protecting protein DprA [Lampropedia hyalina DSM 16112]
MRMADGVFDADIAPWLRLLHTPGVGAVSAAALLKAFGTPAQIFRQPVAALAEHVGLAKARALQAEPPNWEQEREKARIWLQQPQESDAQGVPVTARAIWTLHDPRYPPALREIADPPVLLYVQGKPQWLCGQSLWHEQMLAAVAMVGSRSPTPQGILNARQMANQLQQMGMVVVSGLALGIDAAAHEGALQQPVELAPPTIAVLGTGIDRIYPRQNLALAQAIARHGLVVSEQPLGTAPQAHHFPRRNRIVTGICQGTLVVEAALKSGSLISARLALEQGREVFAIPGSIHSVHARGCNGLIKQGARLVESVQDILDELPQVFERLEGLRGSVASTDPVPEISHSSVKDHPVPISAALVKAPAPIVSSVQTTHARLLDAMGTEPVSLDTLEARLGYSAAELLAQLLELELEGDVQRMPGGWFQRLFMV